MLNAVALEFVIGMDELIFMSLVPHRIRNMVDNLVSMPVPLRSFGGFDARNGITCALTSAFIIYMTAREILPQMNTLQDAKDALCAGERGFVYTIDGAGGLAWSYVESTDTSRKPHRPFPDLRDGPVEFNFAQYALSKVLQGDERREGRPHASAFCPASDCFNSSRRIQGLPQPIPERFRPGCCLAIETTGPIESGTFSVVAKSTESPEYALTVWNPACTDALDLFGLYLYLLQGMFSDAANPPAREGCGGHHACHPSRPFCLDGVCVVPNCGHAAQYCGNSSLVGLRARQFCPITCGCTNPRSGLALSLPESGCGDQCLRGERYERALAQMPCEDVPRDDPDFLEYLDQYEQVLRTWPQDWSASAISVVGYYRLWGCNYLTFDFSTAISLGAFPHNWGGVEPCAEHGTFWPVKSMSFFCPRACGCASGTAPTGATCPGTCATASQAPPTPPAAPAWWG